MATIETTFNLALGEALRTTTEHWRVNPRIIQVEETQTLAGRDKRAKRPDILIVDDLSPPVVIETSFDRHDADRDAQNRLGESTAQGHLPINTALAVAIDLDYKNLSLEEITDALTVQRNSLRYALHQQTDSNIRRWPTSGFIVGNIYDIAKLVTAAALPKEVVEKVATEVAVRVDQAADVLEMALSAKQQKQIAELVYQRTSLKGLRVTMVLWLNALLTQQRLSQQGVSNIQPLEFGASSLPIPSKQAAVWRSILQENWNSIFEPAVRILEKSGSIHPRATGEVLKLLISAVEMIELSRLGQHINVGAELFPKLSDDRKQAAAFYTQPATAELLAGLTIKWDALKSNEWQSEDLFKNYKLADLACGTGTLLRAGYRRITAFHEQAGGTSVGKLHRNAMESGLIGTDINPIAAHLTTSSLVAIGSGEPYGDTRIGWLDVGRSNALTGALEFFSINEVRDLFDDIAGRSTGDETATHSVIVVDANIDCLLMNPPYSRTRGGQSAFDIAGLTDQERLACQNRWRTLVRNEPVNNKAGMAASFLALARRKVKYGGRIGFVLPLTAAFADSWSITRRMIEREFTDIIAVVVASGRALGRDALSADTSMEEMLLVATRRKKKRSAGEDNAAPIHCVTLQNPPARIGEAGEIARAIGNALNGIGGAGTSRPVKAGDDELGQVAVFNAGGEGAPWGPLGVVHADLALAADSLIKGKLDPMGGVAISLNIDMATIDDVFEVGPTHHLIGHLQGNNPTGAFEFYAVTSQTDAIGKDRALWSASSITQKKLVVLPTHKGSSPTNVGSESERDNMRRYQSKLFYARNMRWTSQALLTAMTQRPTMGGRAWTTLGHKDARVQKAFALWANSTFGMVVHWTQGQRTHTGRSTTQIGALKQIPCPRLDRLKDATLNQAAADFDLLAKKDLLPACQAHVDNTRIAIDEAVISMLGLPNRAKDIIVILQWLWCNEPSVHGWNQRALRELERIKSAQF